METKSQASRLMTFAASVMVGLTGALALASAAAVSQAAPTLRHATAAATGVVRLEPVVVTVSKDYFDRVRGAETALACTTDAKKARRA
jgi:hypothetical protein